MIQKLFGCSGVRHGEGKKTIMRGPDPGSLPIIGAERGPLGLHRGNHHVRPRAPLHLHHAQDATCFVIEGTLTVQVGDEVVDLHAGDLVWAPQGVPQTFANVAKEPVRVLNILTPGGCDRVREEYAALPADPREPQVFEQLAQQHKLVFLGPSIPVWLGLV